MEYNQNITVTGYFMSASNQLTFHWIRAVYMPWKNYVRLGIRIDNVIKNLEYHKRLLICCMIFRLKVHNPIYTFVFAIIWGIYMYIMYITFFLSRGGRFANDFYNWHSHEWTSLVNLFASDKKNQGEIYIIIFLTRSLTPLIQKPIENNHQSLISQLLRTFFST